MTHKMKTKTNQWWKRWYSGAYDKTEIVEREWLLRLITYRDKDVNEKDYFSEDVQQLQKSRLDRRGPFTRSAEDALRVTFEDLRIINHHLREKIRSQIVGREES